MVAYNYGLQPTDPKSGLWLTGIDGNNVSQRLKGSDAIGIPTDIHFSPDGRYVSAFSPTNYASEKSGWDIDTDRVIEIAGSGDMKIEEEGSDMGRAHRAVWSPTGSSMAYIAFYVQDKPKSGLYVTSQPGAPGTQLYAGAFTGPGPEQHTLTWASNNTILVKDLAQPSTPTLLLLHLNNP